MNMLYSDDQIVLLFSVAPWRENMIVYKISLTIFFFSYISILIHVTMSSVYRYSLLCNETLLKLFETKSRFLLIILSWTIFFVVWIHKVDVIFEEGVPLSKNAIKNVRREYNIDLNSAAVLGNTLENLMKFPLLGNILFLVFAGILFLGISWLSGYAIHTTLQSKAISAKAKQAHSKALSLLLAQFALPFFFLYIPTLLVEAYSLLVQANIPLFAKIYIQILLSYYPVANAACIIFLTDDFRLYILSTTGGECNVVNVIAIPPPIPFYTPKSSCQHSTHSF